mgnify:CR=1 FL=1|jgi:hypothetical protein
MDKAPFEMLCEYLGWNYDIVASIAIASIIVLSLLFEYLINKKEK